MKKTISIIVLAAALLASLVMFVCYSPKDEGGFSNPLDKDGDNYLYGDKDDEAGKLGTNSNGEANLFDTSQYKVCDKINPTVTVTLASGGQYVSINPKEGREKLKMWMQDGYPPDSSIKYTTGANGDPNSKLFVQEPCLTRNDGDPCMEKAKIWNNTEVLLEAGGTQYKITYQVKKAMCGTKEPVGVATRFLTVNDYIANAGELRIVLKGDEVVPVKVGSGSNYEEQCVTVTVGGETRPEAKLDSIVISKNNSRQRSVDACAKVTLDNDLVKDTKYGIKYYASYKHKTPAGKDTTQAKSVTRTVNVVEDANTQPAVIILNNYTHKLKSGKSVSSPDTMLYVGSKNSDYKEKGVSKVTDSKGQEIPDWRTKVRTTTPTIDGVNDPVTLKVGYEISAGSGYGAKSINRSVYLVENGCDDGSTDPTITVNTANDPDNKTAGSVWNYDGGWSVRDNDVGGNGFKYFIDFDGLNPNSLVAGTYNITYVGLGKCGKKAEKSRTITVR